MSMMRMYVACLNLVLIITAAQGECGNGTCQDETGLLQSRLAKKSKETMEHGETTQEDDAEWGDEAPTSCPTGMTAVAAVTTDGPEALGYCVDTDTSIPKSNNFQDMVKVCEARGATLCSSDEYNAAAYKLKFGGCIVTPQNENHCNTLVQWAVTSDACSSGHYIFSYGNTGDPTNPNKMPYANYNVCSGTYKFSNRYFRCCGGRVQMPKPKIKCSANMTPINGYCIDSVGHDTAKLTSMADMDKACADRGLQLCSASQMMPIARYFDHLLPNKGYGHFNSGGWGFICDREARGVIKECQKPGRNIFQYQNGFQAVNGLCTTDYGISQVAKDNRYFRCCSGNGKCGESWFVSDTPGSCGTDAESVSQEDCESAVESMAEQEGVSLSARGLQIGSGKPCSRAWSHVPLGCSVQIIGKSWTPHFKTTDNPESGCHIEQAYQRICTKKAAGLVQTSAGGDGDRASQKEAWRAAENEKAIDDTMGFKDEEKGGEVQGK